MKSKMILSLLLLCSSLTSQETPVKEAQNPKVTVEPETKEQAIARVTKELKAVPRLVNIKYDDFEDESIIEISRNRNSNRDGYFTLKLCRIGGELRIALVFATQGDDWMFMNGVKMLDRETRKSHAIDFNYVNRDVFDGGTCFESSAAFISDKVLADLGDFSKLAVRLYGDRGNRMAKPVFSSQGFSHYKEALRVLNEAYRLKIDPVKIVPTLGKKFRL